MKKIQLSHCVARSLFVIVTIFFSAAISPAIFAKCDESTNYVLNPEMPSVYLEFEQFGNADDWGTSTLADMSKKPEIKKGKDIWLRLFNNSCWDISLPTLSTYISRIPDPTKPGAVKMLFGEILDGNAANVIYVSAEQDGRTVPWGSDSYAISRLASGHSLVFPVYKMHLEKSRSIYISFNYGWEKKSFSNNLAPDHHAFFWGYRMEEVNKK